MAITPIQRRIAQLAIAKQTVQGTPAASPAYQFGLASGRITDVEITEADLDLTWDNRIAESGERTAVIPMVEWETVTTPSVIGLLLLLALGTDVVTGVGPYTHTLTPAADLPYCTIWGRQDANYYQVSDAKIGELEFTFNKAGALRTKCKALGGVITPLGSLWTGAADSRLSAGYFTAVGGTGTIDGASPGVIHEGSFKFNNNLEAISSAFQISPAAIFPKLAQLDTSLKIIPPDVTLWRKILTGTTSGTTPAATPYFGTEVVKWILDANTDLQITAARIQLMSKFPELAAAGGPAEIDVTGKGRNPSSGAAWTVVLRNAIATY